MGWLQSLRDMGSSVPMDCPRGWGEVTFSIDIDGFPPFGKINKKCPIAGVSNCAACNHPYNPARMEQLRATLKDLELLCEEGKLSESEYQSQRRMLLSFQHSMQQLPGEYSLMTAWVLGPLGIVSTASGLLLGQRFHDGFFAIAGIGAILLAVAGSFGGIGWMKRASYLKQVDGESDQFLFPRE